MRDGILAALLVVPFSLGMTRGGAGRGAGGAASRFQDPEIVESSGLVVRDGLAVTTNDSGDDGRVFVVDVESGETVGRHELGVGAGGRRGAGAGRGGHGVGRRHG